MENKFYYLSTCSTCQKILAQLDQSKFEVQNIKEEKITEKQIDQMHQLAGSYESLFSRRAMKYRSLELNTKDLKEKDYRKWILTEYTFLKRPVAIFNGDIYIGNSKKNVAALVEAMK